MNPTDHWRPNASLATLQLRAGLLASTRAFFAERGVLEVETPVLSTAATTDPHLASLATRLASRPGVDLYLHTSPELAMKRLLAAGCGDIYQICRVFRDGELGRYHQPEFTLVEWYRVGYSDGALRAEVLALCSRLLGANRVEPAETLTYGEAFQRYAQLDPFQAKDETLRAALAASGHTDPGPALTGAELRDLVFTAAVAPRLGHGHGTWIIDFPADQAALAALNSAGLARRFELFIDGLELANGFGELTDADEQRRRFTAELAQREARGLACPPMDEAFLGALRAGLPECAGIAVGFDRLVMLAAAATHIEAVLAFAHRAGNETA